MNEELRYSMKKKSAVICLICVICVPWMLASCVKDELHNTPHPDQGVVSVSVDYPQGAEEDGYTVEVDGQTLDEGDNASNPLTPGEHTVLVYNIPEGFTVTDGIAYVERVDGTRALTDLIDPLPETLYSGTKTVTVVADDTLRLDLDVAQRTRDLHLELTVTEGDPERIAAELTVTEGDPERIAAITGTLSGVAGAYDLRSETLHGEAVSTAPAFTRSGDKIEADLRLLGTKGEAQVLTLRLSFLNGNPQDITIESDLTEQLAGFNLGTETITLDGELHTPTEAGVEAAIIDWKVVDGGSVDAH